MFAVRYTYQLIDNLNQSPFNVGVVIELEDLTTEQVADLNRRHGSPLNFNEERQLIALLGGHPYLVRLALYSVASQRLSSSELFANATADNGPFGNHLRNHLFRLHNKTELVQGMLQVMRQNTCEDERVFFRLRGAGLVHRQGRLVMPRCQLYGEYFRENLRG
ncbi:putative ATPase, archaeal AAA+ ATPase superfamily (plasmid) [Nostoc flagelliforme CCNUN1]|uniref:Putative ATPase, archaeal AAA+ ATPase superfamily n=2 Tax=Nostoc flagelliforme TaxID=1306274 RepID=A0A2K8T7Z9_9NOSO|nr:putative ATPase, archaeal AAA+ ATPase superfamily [Nostoc flagelliforme CCNUN1]